MSGISAITLEEFMTGKREDLIEVVFTESKRKFAEFNIKLKDVMITEIVVPVHVRRAIEEVLINKEQLMAQKYKNQRVEMEIKKEQMVAEAIAKNNRIIDSSLSDKVIRLKYIEAITELVNSSNHKIIVLGDEGIEYKELLKELKD